MQALKGKISIDKLSSLFFRMAAMASKFVIFTFLSKYFDTETYGIYSLQATTITIAIFILGFDFYNFAIRDILIKKKETASKVFTAFVLYGATYILFSGIGYAIFERIDYFASYTWLLLAIGITEHFNQELYRLLLALKKVWIANCLLFIRVAGWTLYILFKILILIETITISDVLMTWMIFNVGTIIFTGIIFGKTILEHGSKIGFNSAWLKKGLKISMVFYAATIFLKIIEYSNRYIVEAVLDEAAAGIFSFYSNFSMVMGIYVSTIVVSYELPALIESSTNHTFLEKLQRYKKLLMLHSVIAAGIVLACIYPILLWQDKTEFMVYWPLLVLLTLGMFLINISLLYHSYLYIKHKEKKLLEIVMISGIFNVLATFILCYFYGLYGAAIAFLLTAIVLYALRRNAVKRKELLL
jgi:O-antigen/teichoic acid export membrane protein